MAYQRYINKFSKTANKRAFGELFSRFFLEPLLDNYTLNFDSTVVVREENQKGTAKENNPKCPSHPSQHPLLVFVSDVRMTAKYWLRPGNTVASTNCLTLLETSSQGQRTRPWKLSEWAAVSSTKRYLTFWHTKIYTISLLANSTTVSSTA